ncbi:MAG TPA: alpha/beta hydrolase-fold protein [Thermoanaerobaculia bacterium]|nr:alpha/beta hydrolase-fold protein [Thermoanaerobaculia bacterium]
MPEPDPLRSGVGAGLDPARLVRLWQGWFLLAAAALVLACASGAPAAQHVPAPLGQQGGRFRVLAPPAPGGAGGPLPVVYFLHDYWGSDAVLWKHGIAQRLLARMASGDLPPFLLIAPQGDHSFWADSWDGARRYETWVGDELPRQVAARWAVRRGRAGRGYVGISMGGMGAMRAGLRHARDTGAIASVSGLLVPLDAAFVRDASPLLRRSLRRAFGPGPDEEALRRGDPYRALGAIDAVPAGERPRLLLLAGRADKYHLDRAAELFHRLATEKGLTAELSLAEGGHDWRYWRAAAEQAIAWTVKTLDEQAPAAAP